MKKCILFSGGVDSFVGWFRMGCPPAINVLLGHKYQELEQKAIKTLCEKVPSLGKSFYAISGFEGMGKFEKSDAEIPARNLFLVTIAAELGYDHIGLVCQQDERMIPDRSEHFFVSTSALLSSLFGKLITIDPVFPEMDKTDMVAWFLGKEFQLSTDELNQRKEWLKQTVACYHPTFEPPIQCGSCPACFRQAIAFTANSIRGCYAYNPAVQEVARLYFKAAKEGKYSEKRSSRIFAY